MADMEHKQKEHEQGKEGSSGSYSPKPCPWCGSKLGLIKVHPNKLKEPFVCKSCSLPPKETSKTVKEELEKSGIPEVDEKDVDYWDDEAEGGEFQGFF